MPEPFDTGGPMTSMSGSTPPKRCYLLELPGELRNRIYDFAIEEPITYFSRRLRACSAEELESLDITEQKPLYRSLTQSCRQLRKEYLPLYAAWLQVRVWHTDIQEFMDAGCPFLSRDNDGQKLLGNLLIDCLSVEVLALVTDEPRVDILSFLIYCSNNPGLRVLTGLHGCKCCRVDWPRLKNVFDALFNVARRPGLSKWLKNAVCSIELEFPDTLWIEMHTGQRRPWMIDYGLGELDPDSKLEYEAWKRLTDITLDDLHQSVMFYD